MKNILLTCCMVFAIGQGYSQTKDTFEVHFPLNVAKLSKQSETYIDKLIFKDILIHGDKLIVLGYTDYVGSNTYNDTLSMQRATNVRDYLIATGFDKNNIKLCVGKGKIGRSDTVKKSGSAQDRKVQIIIDRIAMAQQPTPPAEEPVKNDFSRLNVNESFALNNIFFKLNSPVLLDKSEPDLKLLLDFLQRYRSVKVRIEGHVCCMGPAEGLDSKYKGQPLSDLRAKAIAHYLITRGIDSLRMDAIGLGNRNPVVKNELTEEDKQKNRRVEIRIMSK